jgi:hypothetical protein
MDGEQLGQAMQHIVRPQPALDDDGQRASGELIDDGQHAELAPVLSAIFDEVIGPDMSRVFWPQTNAGSVIQP